MSGVNGARLRLVAVLAALGAFAAVAIFHVPVQSLVVLGIALACPLMMLGMHAGGSHGHSERSWASPSLNRDGEAPLIVSPRGRRERRRAGPRRRGV